jgi:hypothetical protein
MLCQKISPKSNFKKKGSPAGIGSLRFPMKGKRLSGWWGVDSLWFRFSESQRRVTDVYSDFSGVSAILARMGFKST